MTSDEIVKLLAVRHSQDVFVPECKDGPSQYTTSLRLDAWAMNKSWSSPCMYGYEVKVSRSDFVGDHKWTEYSHLCNQLYIVCPAKLIAPDEVKAICTHAGLVWAYQNRLHTKAKALHRAIEPPADLMRYVLMCRARIDREWSPGDRTAYWRDWMAEKDEAKDLGMAASRKIKELVRARIRAAELENKGLENKISELSAIRAFLAEHGMNEQIWSVRDRHKELAAKVPCGLAFLLSSVIRDLTSLQSTVQELTQQPVSL